MHCSHKQMRVLPHRVGWILDELEAELVERLVDGAVRVVPAIALPGVAPVPRDSLREVFINV